MENNDKKPVAEREMFFISSVGTPSGVGIVPHAGESKQLSKKAKEIKEDWDNVLEELNFIIAETEKSTTNSHYSLDEVKVSLGFSAKGKIAFIAEAGIEASIEVTFKKK
jgi:hypothetical protein